MSSPARVPQRRRNSVRICENIISAQCLANNSPEACVQLFAGSLISQAAGAAAAGGGPASLAAIVAPVVIGGERALARTAHSFSKLQNHTSRGAQSTCL